MNKLDSDIVVLAKRISVGTYINDIVVDLDGVGAIDVGVLHCEHLEDAHPEGVDFGEQTKVCRRHNWGHQPAYLLGITGRWELLTPMATQSTNKHAAWGWQRRRRAKVWDRGVLLYVFCPTGRRDQVGQRADKGGGRTHCSTRCISDLNLGNGWISPTKSLCLRRAARACAACSRGQFRTA
jgi:hypothetical protein